MVLLGTFVEMILCLHAAQHLAGLSVSPWCSVAIIIVFAEIYRCVLRRLTLQTEGRSLLSQQRGVRASVFLREGLPIPALLFIALLEAS